MSDKRPEPMRREKAAEAFDHIRERMREIAREEGRPVPPPASVADIYALGGAGA